MTKNEKTENSGIINLESKFWRTTLLIVSVFLVFAGPTYVPYALDYIFKVNYVASIVTGIILLTIGLLMMVYLLRKKIIT